MWWLLLLMLCLCWIGFLTLFEFRQSVKQLIGFYIAGRPIIIKSKWKRRADHKPKDVPISVNGLWARYGPLGPSIHKATAGGKWQRNKVISIKARDSIFTCNEKKRRRRTRLDELAISNGPHLMSGSPNNLQGRIYNALPSWSISCF